MKKRILCLANSKKHHGRCIAGREVLRTGPGPWIRPISNRPTEEIAEDERQYKDGSDPRVLDVVDIPVIRHHPHACQTENWLIDADQYWEKIGTIGWDNLQRFVENPATLWTNGFSTRYGRNDEIPQNVADGHDRSLHLIRAERIEFRVLATGADFGNNKLKVLALFQHRGITYCLSVTDPYIERQYKAHGEGVYNIGESVICVSLGEPYQKTGGVLCRYKLVAAIIQKASVPK
jgi:hypothetical protein